MPASTSPAHEIAFGNRSEACHVRSGRASPPFGNGGFLKHPQYSVQNSLRWPLPHLIACQWLARRAEAADHTTLTMGRYKNLSLITAWPLNGTKTCSRSSLVTALPTPPDGKRELCITLFARCTISVDFTVHIPLSCNNLRRWPST
jgi:hypothetical protein